MRPRYLRSGQDLQVFTTNRDLEKTAEIRIDLADRKISSLVAGEILTGPEAKASNSFENPEVVVARPFDGVTIKNGKVVYRLQPLSFAALTFKIE